MHSYERTSHGPEPAVGLKHQRTDGDFDSGCFSAGAGTCTVANSTGTPSTRILPAQHPNQLQSPARQDSGYDPICNTASDANATQFQDTTADAVEELTHSQDCSKISVDDGSHPSTNCNNHPDVFDTPGPIMTDESIHIDEPAAFHHYQQEWTNSLRVHTDEQQPIPMQQPTEETSEQLAAVYGRLFSRFIKTSEACHKG